LEICKQKQRVGVRRVTTAFDISDRSFSKTERHRQLRLRQTVRRSEIQNAFRKRLLLSLCPRVHVAHKRRCRRISQRFSICYCPIPLLGKMFSQSFQELPCNLRFSSFLAKFCRFCRKFSFFSRM